MAVKIEYKASVSADLKKLDRTTALRVLQKIEKALIAGSVSGIALKGEFAGMYKIRVGDYRVIYVRTDEGFLVLRIGHRRDVYRT